MLNTSKRLAALVRPYLERAMRRHDHETVAALAAQMGVRPSLLSRASFGQGAPARVLELLELGGASQDDVREVRYLLGLDAFPKLNGGAE